MVNGEPVAVAGQDTSIIEGQKQTYEEDMEQLAGMCDICACACVCTLMQGSFDFMHCLR